MIQLSNAKVVEKPVFENMDESFIDSDNITSRTLGFHYLNLGRLDLSNLRLVFLEKFDYLIKFSESKERDYKLFENINNYFDFIDENLAVYSESEYKQLSYIIKATCILMETGVDLKSFYHYYESYISLREDINRFKLSKEIYKEQKIY